MHAGFQPSVQGSESHQGGREGFGFLAEGLNLPVDVGRGFEQVLEGLNGSKV